MKPLLFYSPGSHHSRRVAVLIAELGLDVDVKNVEVRPPGMGGENSSPEFLALNPNGKVPVLRDGDMVLWESSAIMWYLAERHGDTPLWPRDPAKRAQIAKWHLWQGSHLSPAADGLMFEHVVKPMMKQEPDAALCQRLLGSFHRRCGVLDGTLAKGEWLANGELTCADIAVATAFIYAKPARLPMDDHPRVVAWLERIHARPSWKATEPKGRMG
jgi:glutathione S-transferase